MIVRGDRIICAFDRDNECVDKSMCVFTDYNLQEIINPVTPPRPTISVEQAQKLLNTYEYSGSIETKVRERITNVLCPEIYERLYDSIWDGFTPKFKDDYEYLYREAVWAYISSLFPIINDPDKIIADLWRAGFIVRIQFGKCKLKKESKDEN